MAELVLLCTVCLVCKVMGGGFEGNDFGNHHCADWHLHLEYFPEIVEAANLSIQLHSGSPGSPLASSSCPLSPGVSNWQPLALTPHRCSSPLLITCCSTFALSGHMCTSRNSSKPLLWMPLSTIPSTDARHSRSTQKRVGEWGSYNLGSLSWLKF